MKVLKLQILILIFAGVVTSVAVAGQENKSQAKPELSGTWKLDPSKSNAVDIGKRGEAIRIIYSEPELRITRTFVTNGQSVERDFVYFTDGRGETNPATLFMAVDPRRKRAEDLQTEQVKSKTKWQHDRIVTRTSVESRVGGMRLQYLVVDEWKISADGKLLTQTSRFQADPDTVPSVIPSPSPDDKRVYVLISK